MPIDINDETIMRELTRMSLQSATETIAVKAEEFAKNLPPRISASQALIAFAAAIRSTNEKQWGNKGPRHD